MKLKLACKNQSEILFFTEAFEAHASNGWILNDFNEKIGRISLGEIFIDTDMICVIGDGTSHTMHVNHENEEYEFEVRTYEAYNEDELFKN